MVRVGTATAEDNQAFDSAEVASNFLARLSGCMYISPHMLVNCPEVLHYEPSSINMGCFCNIFWHANSQHFPTWSLRQKIGRPASAVGGWCSLTGIGFYSTLNLNTCFFYSCVCILCQNSIIVRTIIKKVINHVKTEIRILHCILPSSLVSPLFSGLISDYIHADKYVAVTLQYVILLLVITMYHHWLCLLWIICLEQAVSSLNLKLTVVEFIHLFQMNVL